MNSILSFFVFLLMGCSPPPCSHQNQDNCTTEYPLESLRLLKRMSIDLRGVLPTLTEIKYIEEHPEDLEKMRNSWLSSAEFEENIVIRLGEHWHTLVNDITLQTNELGLSEQQRYSYVRSVGEEPLRIMAHIMRENQPWTEIVQTDWTMSNHLLSTLWPLDYPESATGWQPSHYTDGRPKTGILSTNGLWWRYTSNASNANRGRAAIIARQLLCVDYLERPVSFQNSTSLDLETSTQTAILTDPTCQSCHSTLDPLASALFGFWWFEDHHSVEMSYYHHERELLGEQILSLTPSWYGSPIEGLSDIGEQIANDPRFARCQVESFAEILWRRPIQEEDFNEISDMTSQWSEQGHKSHYLIKLLTDSMNYQIDQTKDTSDLESMNRMLHSEQLASLYQGLTGFRWVDTGTEILKDDEDGYRVLGGGIDGRMVQQVQTKPTITWVLLTQRTAEAVAQWVVDNDLNHPDNQPILLTAITQNFNDIDDNFATQIDQLFLQLFARHTTQQETEELAQLWQEIAEDSNPQEGWVAVLTFLFRHPDFLFY